MYNRDKMNYKCLNPCQLDDNGDSLVDMISNEPETPRKRKLMETLKDLRVPEKTNVTNDENTVKLIYEDTSNKLFDHSLLAVSKHYQIVLFSISDTNKILVLRKNFN